MVDMYDVFGIVKRASYSFLTEVGVEEADLLIAVTNSDELNLLCCLIAKKAGKCATIARVSNPVYFDEINFIKEEMGISMIINPELAAASEMSRILRIPTAMEINSFAKGKVELLKFVLRKSSILNGMKMKEIGERMRGEVLVCAVERQKDVFIPSRFLFTGKRQDFDCGFPEECQQVFSENRCPDEPCQERHDRRRQQNSVLSF